MSFSRRIIHSVMSSKQEAAFSLSHSSKKKVLNLSIPVPDKPAQIRIVKEYEAYEKCRVKLEDEADNLLSSAQAVISDLLWSIWKVWRLRH